jgi:hypothetical protein
MGQHWIFLTFCGFLIAAVVGFCLFWAYGRIVLLGTQYQYRRRYTEVPPPLSSLPRLSFSPSRHARHMVTTLLGMGSFKEDEESGGVTETKYEIDYRDD